MTPTIIDRFEPVKIDHHHRIINAVFLRAVSNRAQLCHAVAAVVQPRQRVNDGQPQAILH